MLPEAPVGRRPIRFLEEWRHEEWRIKVYGIRHGGPERPDPDLVARAKDVARRALPLPAVTPARYGVGFLGVHQGRGADFVFVDWWEEENELRHALHLTPPGRRGELVPAWPGAPVACVWDLRLMAHERDAWVRHVLRDPAGPDLDAYLADRLHEDA